MQGTGRPGAPIFRSARSLVRDGRLNRALAVPAFLYSINGQLKFAMQLFFKPTTAKMLGNLKVITLILTLYQRQILVILNEPQPRRYNHRPESMVEKEPDSLIAAALVDRTRWRGGGCRLFSLHENQNVAPGMGEKWVEDVPA